MICSVNIQYLKKKQKKAQQFLYRSGQALRVPGG
jgi:hypothetical protein